MVLCADVYQHIFQKYSGREFQSLNDFHVFVECKHQEYLDIGITMNIVNENLINSENNNMPISDYIDNNFSDMILSNEINNKRKKTNCDDHDIYKKAKYITYEDII